MHAHNITSHLVVIPHPDSLPVLGHIMHTCCKKVAQVCAFSLNVAEKEMPYKGPWFKIKVITKFVDEVEGSTYT